MWLTSGTNLKFLNLRASPAVDLSVGSSKSFGSSAPRNHNLPSYVLHRAGKELDTSGRRDLSIKFMEGVFEEYVL